MKNKIDKYYLNYNKCMKLKKRGYNVFCDKLYGPYPHYNNEPLGSDEEYELRAEGKGNEIIYKVIDQSCFNKNSELDEESCSCPEINDVIDWLLINWNVHITVKPYWNSEGLNWFGDVHYINDNFIQLMHTITRCKHKYEAYAKCIEWVLDNYKTI